MINVKRRLLILSAITFLFMTFSLTAVVGYVLIRGGSAKPSLHIVEAAGFSEEQGVRFMKPGPEGPGFEIVSATKPDGGIEHNLNLTRNPDVALRTDPLRLKMTSSPDRNESVTGRIGGATEYPVILDTGCPYMMAVKPLIVLDGDALFYPLPGPTGSTVGFCYIDNMNLGDADLTHLFGVCFDRYWVQKHKEAIIWKERAILLGLPILQQFATFRIDRASGEIVLSEQSFQPENEADWLVFPMSVRKMPIGGDKLFVEFPLPDGAPPVSLDTGDFGGLFMTTDAWDQLRMNWDYTVIERQKVTHTRFEEWFQMVYNVRELTLGELSLPNAEVKVADAAYYKEDYMLMGIGLFRDRTIILDFEGMRLWVEKDGTPQ